MSKGENPKEEFDLQAAIERGRYINWIDRAYKAEDKVRRLTKELSEEKARSLQAK